MSSTGLSVRLITGPSGTGKTSLAATFAKWLWQKHKKVTRLYTADGGGYGTTMERLIQLGIVELFRMRTRVGGGSEGLVEETCSLSAQGWWPESFASVERGEVLPATKMISPVTISYSLYCQQGHLVVSVERQAQLSARACPVCKQAVTMQTGKVTKAAALAPHMARVGGVVFEGITSWSNWQLQALADRRGRLELHGEKSNIGRFVSGDIAFDGNNRADYGFAQGQAEKWLLASTGIPGLMESPLWTGLETRVEETGQALSFWAPAIAGTARSGQVPQWVGDWLGAVVVFDEKGKPEHRFYLTKYVGQDGVPHGYKVRAEPGALPEYLSDSGGSAFSGFSLGVYLDLISQGNAKALESAKAEFPDAPGLPEGKIVQAPVVPAPAKPGIPVAPAPAKPGVPRALPQAGMRPGSLPPPKPPQQVK